MVERLRSGIWADLFRLGLVLQGALQHLGLGHHRRELPPVWVLGVAEPHDVMEVRVDSLGDVSHLMVEGVDLAFDLGG